ncbi:hypothetical protein [Aeromonas veronii]|uniref:hypothetical protein n=1 Tax=Aeromonas veronii TaxID=654 RepID=UPI003BA2C2FE
MKKHKIKQEILLGFRDLIHDRYDMLALLKGKVPPRIQQEGRHEYNNMHRGLMRWARMDTEDLSTPVNVSSPVVVAEYCASKVMHLFDRALGFARDYRVEGVITRAGDSLFVFTYAVSMSLLTTLVVVADTEQQAEMALVAYLEADETLEGEELEEEKRLWLDQGAFAIVPE